MREVHARDYTTQLFPMGRERAGSHRLLWQIVRFTAVTLATVGLIGIAFA